MSGKEGAQVLNEPLVQARAAMSDSEPVSLPSG